MLRADGSFAIIEMNPRFSGTLALTTAAGINFASLTIDMVEGTPIPDLFGKHADGVTMMRYWSEVFEDPDGALRPGTSLVCHGEPFDSALRASLRTGSVEP